MIADTISHTTQLLVFDSGVGGMSVVREIRRHLPAVNIDYLADNAWFPYGLIDDGLLIERVTQLISTYCDRHPIDLVVVACNTASTIALDRLRATLPIPVVGVVPAIKPAAAISETKVIGLLATPGTIKRPYTENLIAEFAADCRVIRIGSSELVHWVEQKYRGLSAHSADIAQLLSPLREHEYWPTVDTVVLACTHFPLALDELRLAAPEVKHWIDSGDAIARRVKSLLSSIEQKIQRPATNRCLFTHAASINKNIAARLNPFGYTNVELFND